MHTLIHTRISAAKMMVMGLAMASAWSTSCVANNEPATENPVDNHSPVHGATLDVESSIHSSNNNAESMVDLTTLSMTVYKSPTCGCCVGWVEYMKEEGFTVDSVDTDDMDSIKKQLGLTSPRLHSCHTAVIDGYVIEGHVPANDVKRLLSEKPDLLGLTAPGMPMLSPGMASRTPKGYDVLLVDEAGGARLWSSY